MKKRGFLLTLENVIYDESLEHLIENLFPKLTFKIIQFEEVFSNHENNNNNSNNNNNNISDDNNSINEKNYDEFKNEENDEKIQEKMAEMKNKSLKMYRRAYHMLYSMKRWKKREEILKEIETGNNVILINYCFKEISECICEDIDFDFAKTTYTGLIRPDKVLYFDDEKCKISTYFEFFKYVTKIKSNNINEYINDLKFNIELLINDYSKNKNDDFNINFYPNSIGEDLFMFVDV